MRTRLPTSRSVTHPIIPLGQTRLTLEFFSNELPEKKLQLVGMSILSILLSHVLRSHIPTLTHNSLSHSLTQPSPLSYHLLQTPKKTPTTPAMHKNGAVAIVASKALKASAIPVQTP